MQGNMDIPDRLVVRLTTGSKVKIHIDSLHDNIVMLYYALVGDIVFKTLKQSQGDLDKAMGRLYHEAIFISDSGEKSVKMLMIALLVEGTMRTFDEIIEESRKSNNS